MPRLTLAHIGYDESMSDSTIHVPVMPEEVISWLRPRPGDVVVDGTLGGGGHTKRLAAAVGDAGRVVAVDRDAAAVERAEKSLQGLPIFLAHSSYTDIPEVLDEVGLERVNGILLDLGLSSDQLADHDRGFSFQADGPLDLRFDTETGSSAAQLLTRVSQEKLANLIFEFGEERYSRRIARAICERQREQPIETAGELAEIVRRSVPPAARHLHIHPATKTFQALRIAVNDELQLLRLALKRLPDALATGGRIAIISFHSLEDRIVKRAFRDDDRLQILTRKPQLPSDSETHDNPRARSAKLRVAERK